MRSSYWWVGAALATLAFAEACDDNSGTGGSGSTSAQGSTNASSSTGSGTTGDYACAGNVMLPAAPGASGTVQIGIAGGFGDSGPVEGVKVDLCAKNDPACAAPIATGTTDAAGHVDLMVPFGPNGFDGFGIATKTGYYRSLLIGSIPYVPAYGRIGFGTAPQANLDALLATSFGINPDPTKGHVYVAAQDCKGKLAAGVTFKASDPSVQSYYTAVNGQPDPKATATSADGKWLVVNVAPGTLGIDLVVGTDVVGHIDAPVQANTVSEVFLNPTP